MQFFFFFISSFEGVLTEREGDVIAHAQQLAETHRASISVYPQLLHTLGSSSHRLLVVGGDYDPVALGFQGYGF